MHNEEHIHVDEALMVKYLYGEAEPEEAMAVDDWLEASEANRETFRQVAKLYGGEPGPLPDAATAWKRFSASRRPRYRYGWWAAAASLLLCVALLYLFVQKRNNTPVSAGIAVSGAIVRDTLPDGSVVVVPPGGQLMFDERFAPRAVRMEGEAFFDVRPDGARPFTVQAGEVLIHVLGTAFNVEITQALIQVKVSNGSIRATTETSGNVVGAGEVYVYHRANRQAQVKAIADTGRNSYAYATRHLVFDNAPLSTVIAEVSKAYNVRIRLEEVAAGECRISTVFSEKPLEYVLDVITVSLGLQYNITANDINITGNGCR